MTTTREDPFDLVAADEESALAEASTLKGVDRDELKIIAREPLSHLPWQPRKFRFTLVRLPHHAESRDGSWTVEYRLGKVWLTVRPPQGSGSPVMHEAVLTARRSWPEMASFDRDRLYAAIEQTPDHAVDVGTFDLPKATSFLGLISPNDMAGYLVLGTNRATADSLQEAQAALDAAGIASGVDPERLRAAVAEGKPGEAHLVALGTESEAGEDAKLVPGSSAGSPLIRPDGALDFTASTLDEPVGIGDPLLMIQPGKAGSEGLTVRGTVLPTTFGKQLDLAPLQGQGVALSPDGAQLVAAVAGTPQRLHDRISVLPLQRVSGNLEANVEFAGNVVIDGNVAAGLSVRADGDILVKGSVQSSRLEADGSIVLRRGMFGGGKGEAHAKIEIRAEALRDCTVTAGTDIHVVKEITQSTVTAGNSILAAQATIVGGMITAGNEIVANVVGSPQRTLTKLLIQPAANHPAPLENDAGGGSGEPTHRVLRPEVRVHDRIFAPAEVSIGILTFLVEYETPFCRFIEDHGAVVVRSFA